MKRTVEGYIASDQGGWITSLLRPRCGKFLLRLPSAGGHRRDGGRRPINRTDNKTHGHAVVYISGGVTQLRICWRDLFRADLDRICHSLWTRAVRFSHPLPESNSFSYVLLSVTAVAACYYGIVNKCLMQCYCSRAIMLTVATVILLFYFAGADLGSFLGGWHYLQYL